MTSAGTTGLRWKSGAWVGDRYRVLRMLAEGGMSTLYVAEHLALRERVVLKVAGQASGRSEEMLTREAQALASLRHPNIVRAMDLAVVNERQVLTLELIDGQDLAELLRAQGPLDRESALSILRQLAGALDHAHVRGIVHRDVKPANVMVRRDGVVKLVDFGLAMRATNEPTETWTVLGTPSYMAPEQVLGGGGQLGPATDRYALAALALELLTGERPYEERAALATMLAISERPPRRPSALGVPSVALDAIFVKAMAREPERRFQSCATFVEAIADALRHVLPKRLAPHPIEAAPTLRVGELAVPSRLAAA